MDDPQAVGAAVGAFAEVVGEDAEGSFVALRVGGDGEKAGGLADDEDFIVFVDDAEAGWQRGGLGRGLLGLDADDVSRL